MTQFFWKPKKFLYLKGFKEYDALLKLKNLGFKPILQYFLKIKPDPEYVCVFVCVNKENLKDWAHLKVPLKTLILLFYTVDFQLKPRCFLDQVLIQKF